MARALVSTIIDQLGSLIASEFKDRLGSLFASEVTSILNVEEEVERLKLKLQAIQAKLDDAEERQVKEKAVKLWLERLNDVFYEMGDVLDEWNTAKIKAEIEKEEEAETSTAKRRKVLSLTNLNSSVSTVSQRRDIALKIKEITEKLDEIDREGDMYQFVLTSGNEEVVRPPTDSHVDVSNILGRDKVKGDLVSFLLGRGNEEERSPHVISLVGMGGVGKTTLAQLAYIDSEVNSGHFEKKGWVCVSDPFNKFMVAKAIIKSFGDADSNTTDWPSLMDEMCDLIRGRKLFLVLDDVWTEDSMLWEPFKLALQNAAQGSRILVTTRKSRVADIMGSAEMINLEELSDDDCWSIFSTIAFFDRDSEQRKDLEEIGRKISDKCKGLPLAARTLGSLMRFKSRNEQWEMVFCSRLWELQDVERGLFAPLLLSYYDLPSPLRRCFSYCAVFPKDYSFDEEDLVSMWIAQGYIELNANKDRIVARDYFEILVIRSLFQDCSSYGIDQIFMRFKMHDIVHDLAQFMAKNECITINGYEESGLNLQNARHLYLEIPTNAQIPESIYGAKNLRTLFFVNLRDHNLSKLFQHFTRLWTLTLSYQLFGTKTMELPDAIGNLLHLRYLKIHYFHQDRLPETICNLCNLQVLNIKVGPQNELKKLPHGMSKLINLKHLIFGGYWKYPFELPRGIGRLSSLTRLSHFVVGGKDDSQRCELGELKYLNHLQGTLKIYGLGNVVDACEAKNAELKKKIGLRDLSLHFSEESVENDGGRMETDVSVLNALEPPPGLEKLEIAKYWGTTMFPNWMMSLAKLKSLSLTHGKNLELLPPLGKLQFLEYFSVCGVSFPFKKVGVEFLGIEFENKKDGIIKIFPNLKTLWFSDLDKWEEWIGIGGQEEEDCIIIMPCLQMLHIEFCPKLKSLPDFLFKTSLQEFDVSGSQILCKRYQRGTGEDWAKISHIPNIQIDDDDEEESDEEEFDQEEQSEDEELMNSPAGRITEIVYEGSHNHPKPQQQLAIKHAKESISDSEDLGSPCVVELTGPGDSENEDGVGDEPNLKKRTTYAVTEPKIIKQTRSEVCASNGNPRQDASLVLSSFEDMLSWPKIWHKLTANPTTQAYLQNIDFVRMMHELHNNYLKDKRVIQALGVLLNINIWTPTSVDAEIPQSSSLLSLQPERKKSAETELAKELDLMELTADEGMDRESQACKEQEMGNAAYTKNDFDTAIAHYTKVMELDDGNISCLMNRAVAYLAIGQYDECIKDCDKVVERGRQLKSDSMMIAITLSRKGTALVKMAKHSKDYEPAIESFQKALSEHCIPGTLKKLNDAEQAKRELEQQEYFDTKLADEEHEKASREANVSSSGNQSQPLKPTTKKNQCLLGMPDPDVEVVALSPKTLLATNEFVCEICKKGFKREPNLQLHRRGHNLSWKPSQGSVSTVDSSPPMPAPAQAQARLAPPQSTGVISLVLPIKSPEETSENEIASEHHGMEIDIEEVKMTDSSEQKKFENEEMGNDASQTRQPDVIQVEDMQLQASSTLKPQRVLFDVNAVNILKSSGLIQSQIEDIEMKSEASEQRGFFLMQGGLGLTMLPKDEDWKNAKEIYLMDNELSILPENPRCPNLSALFLPRNYKLRTIPVSFFDHMPALQILNLSRTSIKSLPDSIIKSVSLKRLFLNNCHRLMTLSPKVGDLKQLEVIDLEGAKIMDLPMEIKELTNLKYLEVSFYGYISNGNGKKAMQSNAVVPCGVISALSLLEELNIDVNPDDEWWDARAEDIVTEICTLKRLETLKFYFPRVELLRHFQWNSLTLSYFRFTIGRHVKRIMSRVPCDVEFELERWGKYLKYINGVGVPGDIKKVLQHAVAFFLDRHATVKKLSDFGLRNMKQLKCCVMGECNEVQVIVDEADADEEDDARKIVSDSYGTERIVLGSLEYLYIYYMKNLRSIWEGSVQKNSLFLLKSLTLRTCPQLTTIFTQGLLDNLCNLEELKVEDCPSIKSIVSCEISAEHKTSYFLPNLKKISLHYMPGLVSISSGLHIAPKLEWLSFYNCPDLKNPLIDEISSQDLKKIKGERSWWEALEWSNSCPSYLEEIFVLIDIRDC